ncbi:MAG: N-6 DNA methylase, partial [Chthoniobacterales bacterium]|nr:N-6 DNA methylase [Chthoniobacterales bacterium]
MLAAEVAYLYGSGKFLRSYVAYLDDRYSSGGVEGLRNALGDLEHGGVFKNLLNIVNFVEGDYFSWYLDVIDEEFGDAVAELARRMSDYEPATPHLEPEATRDLLKRLYQSLIPRDVRHKLGEYYTPDWLAELLLDEVGFTVKKFEEIGAEGPLKPLELRVLDPACGSGTFLVLCLKRLREYAENHYLTDQFVEYVLRNVVGYDLNPLAVLAARTNFLLAIGDLLGSVGGPIEIPVYLADSILVEQAPLDSDVFLLRTSVGNFAIPKIIIEKGLLSDVIVELDRCVRGKHSIAEFEDRLREKFGFDGDVIRYLLNLFSQFLKLEREGKNHVWVSIIRNAFAPVLKGKFDFVVGNPPWINWENLPESYRNVSRQLWEKYGLAKMSGGVALGKVKR